VNISSTNPALPPATDSAVTPKVNVAAPVGPGSVKPINPLPGAVKPVTPGAISPISPVRPNVPGAVMPVTPGQSPLKPISATPPSPVEMDKKTGTAVIKNAPPKETARITVKPNLPSSAGGGVQPVAKVAVPVAAGAVIASAASVRGGEKTPKSKAITVPMGAPTAGTIRYQEEEAPGSTTLTTSLAAALAVMTWGIAIFLFGSVYQLF
jgi:hypothetical protein